MVAVRLKRRDRSPEAGSASRLDGHTEESARSCGHYHDDRCTAASGISEVPRAAPMYLQDLAYGNLMLPVGRPSGHVPLKLFVEIELLHAPMPLEQAVDIAHGP